MPAPPSPPFIPAKYHGGPQDRIDRIVMHGTVSDTERGGARAIARYFQSPSYQSSAHYVCDPGEAIQCVGDHTIAWHDGTNTNSIGVELCDQVDADPDRWAEPEHQAMLRVAAKLVRQLCDAYGVPKVKLTPADIRKGRKGICGHADMRDAFPGSTTHHDPGAGFPWQQFMDLVRGEAIEVPGPRDTLTIGMGTLTRPNGKVKWLQTALVKRGHKLPVTGRFGPATRAAVAAFQRSRKLGFTGTRWAGIAGPRTIAALKAAIR